MQTYTKTLTIPRSRQTAAQQRAAVLAVPTPAEVLTFLGVELARAPSALVNTTHVVKTITLLTTPAFEAAYPTDAMRLGVLGPLFVGEHAAQLRAPVTFAIAGP